MKQFNVGDIVYVEKYDYKTGKGGSKHIFVIINEGQAIDINYFGFLLSSHTEKSTYPFNEELNKDKHNRLHKDSIVKCDDLIEIPEKQILFKIGIVDEEDLERFINTYMKYTETIED